MFWEEKGSILSNGKKKWNKVLNGNFKHQKLNGLLEESLNITENCLDRHLKLKSNKVAIIWEPNNPKDETIKITYKELYQKVSVFSNVLKSHGVKKEIEFVYICQWFQSWLLQL